MRKMVRLNRSFVARYEGICPVCGNSILPGDEVIYDGDDRLVHEECR